MLQKAHGTAAAMEVAASPWPQSVSADMEMDRASHEL